VVRQRAAGHQGAGGGENGGGQHGRPFRASTSRPTSRPSIRPRPPERPVGHPPGRAARGRRRGRRRSRRRRWCAVRASTAVAMTAVTTVSAVVEAKSAVVVTTLVPTRPSRGGLAVPQFFMGGSRRSRALPHKVRRGGLRGRGQTLSMPLGEIGSGSVSGRNNPTVAGGPGFCSVNLTLSPRRCCGSRALTATVRGHDSGRDLSRPARSPLSTPVIPSSSRAASSSANFHPPMRSPSSRARVEELPQEN
jgi:hypothetical protein